jgi:hypothetical protein
LRLNAEYPNLLLINKHSQRKDCRHFLLLVIISTNIN